MRDELEPLHQSKSQYELINHNHLDSTAKPNPKKKKEKEENQILTILHNNIIHT